MKDTWNCSLKDLYLVYRKCKQKVTFEKCVVLAIHGKYLCHTLLMFHFKCTLSTSGGYEWISLECAAIGRGRESEDTLAQVASNGKGVNIMSSEGSLVNASVNKTKLGFRFMEWSCGACPDQKDSNFVLSCYSLCWLFIVEWSDTSNIN